MRAQIGFGAGRGDHHGQRSSRWVVAIGRLRMLRMVEANPMHYHGLFAVTFEGLAVRLELRKLQ